MVCVAVLVCAQGVVEMSSQHVKSSASTYGTIAQSHTHRRLAAHAHGAALCLLCVPVALVLRLAHDVSWLERHESLPDPP